MGTRSRDLQRCVRERGTRSARHPACHPTFCLVVGTKERTYEVYSNLQSPSSPSSRSTSPAPLRSRLSVASAICARREKLTPAPRLVPTNDPINALFGVMPGSDAPADEDEEGDAPASSATASCRSGAFRRAWHSRLRSDGTRDGTVGIMVSKSCRHEVRIVSLLARCVRAPPRPLWPRWPRRESSTSGYAGRGCNQGSAAISRRASRPKLAL